MSDGDPRSALETLHAAIQAFSNALCRDSDDAGLVSHEFVVWEEVSFAQDDGATLRQTVYAATGDGATASSSVGLAAIGLAKVRRDVLGGCCDGS